MAKKLKNAVTPLEKFVAKTLNAKIEDGYNIDAIVNDILSHGCESGMIGALIYHVDTLAFYQLHQQEIDNMLQELCNDCGSNPAKFFGDKWEKEDFFARDTNNQNLLAWFGFEETARHLANKNGIDV